MPVTHFFRMTATATLRPLVEPDSVLFGNAEPLAALGFSLTGEDGPRP